MGYAPGKALANLRSANRLFESATGCRRHFFISAETVQTSFIALRSQIEVRSLTCGVVGLGYVGLPLAVEMGFTPALARDER